MIETIVIKCCYCGVDCVKLLKEVTKNNKNGQNTYCSKECKDKSATLKHQVHCQ